MSTKLCLASLSFVGLMSIMTAIAVPASAESKQETTPVKTETTPKPKPASADPALTPKPASAETPVTSTKTIVDVASEAGNFNTLAAALKAAGLETKLDGKGPFTVFAPTDKAFADLPAGTVERLLKPENKNLLVKVLSYHVVSGSVLSKDLKSGEVPTVEGTPINVKVSARSVMVNNAKVTSRDLKASNGVIHVIDRVIIPPDMLGTTQPTQKPTGTTPTVKPETKPAVKPEAAPAVPATPKQ